MYNDADQFPSLFLSGKLATPRNETGLSEGAARRNQLLRTQTPSEDGNAVGSESLGKFA